MSRPLPPSNALQRHARFATGIAKLKAITRTPAAKAERRTCPVCQRSIFICETKQGRAFREHDDQPVNGKLCDGSWRAV